MLISDYKKAIPFLIKAKVTPLVWGGAGIGKSSLVRQICKDNGWGFYAIHLGNMSDTGDVLGLADFETDENGNKVATKFMMPDWLNNALKFCKENPDKYFVLHMDEINRTRKDLLVPVFQIALDRCLNTIKFPENFIPLASANPNNDDYVVTDISDRALLSRFVHIKLTPSLKEWTNYAEESEYDSSIINFINEQPGMLEEKGQDFTLDFVKPCRRSYAFINNLKKANTPEKIFQELCYGIIGVAATTAYFKSLENSDKPISGKEILKSYKKHNSKVKSWSNLETGGRPDLVNSSTESLVKTIQSLQKDNKKMTKTEGKNMLEFLKDIPLDRSFAAVQDIYLEDCARDFFSENEEPILSFAKMKAQTAV